MVLVIKQQSNLASGIVLLCKMILNIEHNKFLYKMNGDRTSEEESKKSFNSFTDNQVDYDITVSTGTIVLYSMGTEPAVDISRMFKQTIGTLEHNINNAWLPIVDNRYKSTHYTIATTNKSVGSVTDENVYHPSYRKFIVYYGDVKKVIKTGSKFVWYIRVINTNINKWDGDIQITELSNRFPSKHYLMRSISTIIYDMGGVLNTPHGLHQIDYPYLSQYNKSNQIVESLIIISQQYGLDYEIYSIYSSKNPHNILFGGVSYPLVSYGDYKIRRINLNKKWYSQLSEDFDYEEQEDLESKMEESGKTPYPNDVCFISRIPLYNFAYVIKVAYLPNGTDINTKSISHILVSPYMYHSCGNIFANFEARLRKKNIKVLEINVAKYPRTEAEVILKIPDNLISPIKRNLLHSISVNGIYKKSIIMYSADVAANQIFVGMPNCLYDTDVLTYNDTNTILFAYELKN